MQTLEARAADADGVLSKDLGRSSASSIASILREFYESPLEADFDQKVVAVVLGYSEPWLERARVYGGGPAFVRLGGRFVTNKNGDRRLYGGKVRYPKTGVLEFRNKRKLVNSTSEYVEPKKVRP